MRKKVQLLLALTILAWATQTLFAQWARGAETFVPRQGSSVPAGTLELRSEARVYGDEVKLKQVCRWAESDAELFAPVADVVLTKVQQRRPYQVVTVTDVRRMLEDAGINVARIRISGPLECTVSRADVNLKEGEALQEWVKTQEKSVPRAAEPVAQPASAKVEKTSKKQDSDDTGIKSLRELLEADLAVRLALGEDQLVLSFDPRDEGALNLSGPQFKFNIQARRARDLGDVAWDVVIVGPAGQRKAEIRATARAWQNQLLAARPLARRQVIQASDVIAKRTLTDKLPEGALLKSEQVVGQMAGRDLKPGTIMTASLVEAVPLAKVGQFISVTLEHGSVRIKSVAKAMEGGCYGQTIRVKNEATKDVYQVILTGPQEATMAPDNVVEDKSVASAAVR
jgi:flagella basal body P-ring formation protein FlgA